MESKINILNFPQYDRINNLVDTGLVFYYNKNNPLNNDEQTNIEREMLKNSTKDKHIIIGIDLSGSMSSSINGSFGIHPYQSTSSPVSQMSYIGQQQSISPAFQQQPYPPHPIRHNNNPSYNNKSEKMKKDIVKDAIFELIDFVWSIKSTMRLSIFAFDERTKLIVDNANSSIPIESVKEQIRIAFDEFGGSTNILNCINKMIEMMHKENIENCNMFLLTDGYNSNYTDNPIIENRIKEENIFDRITCYGIGKIGCYDENLLKIIGKNVYGCASNDELLDNIVGTVYSKCSSLLSDIEIKINCQNITTTLEMTQNENYSIVKISSFGFSQIIPIFCSNIQFPLSCDISYKHKDVNENHHIEFANYEMEDIKNTNGIKQYCILQKWFVDEVTNAIKKTPMQHKVSIGEIEIEMTKLLRENKIPSFIIDKFSGMLEDVKKYYRGLHDDVCEDISTFSRYCGLGALALKTTTSCGLSTSNTRTRTNAITSHLSVQTNVSVPARNADECKICMSEQISVIFLPCKHVACCDNCSMKLVGQKCPICKQNISNMTRFILPGKNTIMCQKCGIRTIKTVNKPCMHATLCNECASNANNNEHFCEICNELVSNSVKIFRS